MKASPFLAVALLATSMSGAPTLPKLDELKGDKVSRLLAPDAIPSIDNPELVKADDAIFMTDGEPVIGVVINGQARAYSTWHLDHHEIVNDRVEGSAIAVTW